MKVVHYCVAGSKPWRCTGEEANMDREDIKMLVKKWNDTYNDQTLDLWNYSDDDAAMPVANTTPPVALAPCADGRVPAPSAA